MIQQDCVSEEMLHALIDGELEPVEAEQLYSRIGEDETLANRVCILRGMKDMVRLAYSHPPAPSGKWQTPWQTPLNNRRGMQQAIAAGLLLTLGIGAGWLLHSKQAPSIALQETGGAVQLGATAADANRIIMHIDSASHQKFDALLDRADLLLTAAHDHKTPLQVEVLANSNGLNLLRADRSPFADRIAELTKKHPNLHFVVCAQTVARFTREEGRVVLMPEAKIAPSAIGEVVDRLQEGWTYIKI
jgi:intracellular sulfur oxidation DsrE/DsrF family protein